MSNESIHEKYAAYVKARFIEHLQFINDVRFYETDERLNTTPPDMHFHLKDVHEITYNTDDTLDKIAGDLELVILKFVKQTENIKRIFCPDHVLDVLYVNGMPIVSQTEKGHQMRMHIVITRGDEIIY
jgi:hypothetical protein